MTMRSKMFYAFSNALCKRYFNSKIGIIGVPSGKGTKYGGVKEKGLQVAPDAIRAAILPHLKIPGLDVKDYGNVVYTPMTNYTTNSCRIHNCEHVIPMLEKVQDAVCEIVNDGRLCLTLGGDHSIAAGSIIGHLKAVGEENLAVLYIDAHADCNVPATSSTGNIHGMTLTIAVKECISNWSNFQGIEKLSCRVPFRQVGFIGLRDVEEIELDLLNKHEAAFYPMTEVVRLGIVETLKRVLSRIDPNNDKKIHLSIDTDSLDPSEAPSTTVPVRGGLLLRELLFIVEEVAKTGRLSAVDVVELNPLLGSPDDQKKTIEAIRDAILACCGRHLSKYIWS